VARACSEPCLIVIESRGAVKGLIHLGSPSRSTRFAAQLRVDNLVDHRVEVVFGEVRAKRSQPSFDFPREHVTPGFARVFRQVTSPLSLIKSVQERAHTTELADMNLRSTILCRVK